MKLLISLILCFTIQPIASMELDQEWLDEELLDAITTNDKHTAIKVKNLLKQGANANATREKIRGKYANLTTESIRGAYAPALFLAISRKQVLWMQSNEIIELLINHGADIHANAPWICANVSPQHISLAYTAPWIESVSPEYVNVVRRKNYHTHPKHSFWSYTYSRAKANYLAIAACMGNRLICELLLNRGAHLDLANEFENNTLLLATKYWSIKHEEYVELSKRAFSNNKFKKDSRVQMWEKHDDKESTIIQKYAECLFFTIKKSFGNTTKKQIQAPRFFYASIA